MAAKRPIAVAIRASAIGGATIESVAFLTAARATKACMMPQTVPNRPMYGLMDPTVASVARWLSSASTSRDSATFICL